ncbi:MAG TPA: molybdopterin-dependent oxidoreductase [Gaiellaceae bacterium]|jgi:DMSO/TMAO reductase YedYZ molybdopterin-dependent catalytic subunit
MPEERRLGRAAFIAVTAVGLSSLAWGRSAWDALARLYPDDLGSVLPGPTSGWRIYTVAASMPELDRRTYRLRVDGLVRRPVSFRLDDLERLPQVEQVSDFHCVTGWSVEDVRWRGVRIEDVLAAAEPLPGAGALSFVSAERPYVDSLTMAQALLPDVLLAWDMDSRPLSRPHGAPLRLVVPRMYGYKSVKWVERIVVTRTPELGYWEQRGYDRDAWVGRSNAA